MAKKSKRLNTKKLKKLTRNKRLLKYVPFALLLGGVLAGLLIAWLQPPDVYPRNLVWAADKDVKIPDGLTEYLYDLEDCKGYRGTNTAPGVGLWGVYESSKNKFAKISYGCSTHLSIYIMAVKDKDNWKLLQPTEYFAARTSGSGPVSSYLPNCSMIDTYQIDKSIEPFCIEPGGSPRENSIQ